MGIKHLAAGTGVAIAVFGGMLSLSTAATASPPAPAGTASAQIKSCPGDAPAPNPGYRCLSYYAGYNGCLAGVKQWTDTHPGSSSYCRRQLVGAWGYVSL